MDTLSVDWTSGTPGWNGFTLDSPWFYDGTGNVIVEFRYYGSTGTTVNVRAMNLPSGDRCLDAGFPDSPTGSFMSFLTCLRVHYTPTGVPGGGSPENEMRTAGNPGKGGISVMLSLQRPENVVLEVYSIAGRLVRTPAAGWLDAGEHRLELDLHDLAPGLYLMVCSGIPGAEPFVLLE